VGLARSLTSPGSKVAELARLIEGSGYDSIWVGEHLAMPVKWQSRFPFTDDGSAPFDHTVPYTEAMVTLGFLAGVTNRVRLGTSVIPVNTRHPLALAKQAASVDLMSDGRLELGLGSGWLREEGPLLGLPDDHLVQRLEEFMPILRSAWTEREFAYEGTYYSFPPVGIHPHPVQNPLPIWIGGLGPRLIALASEHAVGVIVPARDPESTLAMVRTAASNLPAGHGIAVVTGLSGEPVRDLDFAQALAEAGATRLVLGTSLDESIAKNQLSAFATDALPSLSEDTSRAAPSDQPRGNSE